MGFLFRVWFKRPCYQSDCRWITGTVSSEFILITATSLQTPDITYTFAFKQLGKKSRLTLRRVRKPPRRRQGTAPCGWRCGPGLWGNARAWQSRTPSWWCWRQPACCSALHLPCPRCCRREGPGATRAPSLTAGPADPSHPELDRSDLSSSKQVEITDCSMSFQQLQSWGSAHLSQVA